MQLFFKMARVARVGTIGVDSYSPVVTNVVHRTLVLDDAKQLYLSRRLSSRTGEARIIIITPLTNRVGPIMNNELIATMVGS